MLISVSFDLSPFSSSLPILLPFQSLSILLLIKAGAASVIKRLADGFGDVREASAAGRPTRSAGRRLCGVRSPFHCRLLNTVDLAVSLEISRPRLPMARRRPSSGAGPSPPSLWSGVGPSVKRCRTVTTQSVERCRTVTTQSVERCRTVTTQSVERCRTVRGAVSDGHHTVRRNGPAVTGGRWETVERPGPRIRPDGRCDIASGRGWRSLRNCGPRSELLQCFWVISVRPLLVWFKV